MATTFNYEIDVNSWDEVERESGVKVVHMTGGLDLTRKSSVRSSVLDEYADAMSKQNIPLV